MNLEKKKARLIAFYLPQYHPIPENDTWWGPGFTEWVSVAQARPLFDGHAQPHIPGELGFYDLRLAETRERQASLAAAHGIEGFCYWHYWLGHGKRLLELPFNEVLRTGKPNFPFCLGWANHSWKGVFFGADNRTLIEQYYGDEEEWSAHFKAIEKAFHDERYMCVENKRIFFIFHPYAIPNCQRFVEYFRERAQRSGLEGLFVVGGNILPEQKEMYGLDAVSMYQHRIIQDVQDEVSDVEGMEVYSYERAMKYFLRSTICRDDEIPSIITNWDTTPRLGKKGMVLRGRTPELFERHVQEVLSSVEQKPFERRLVFVKSWNEWAEGNYLEPDWESGRTYLECLAKRIYQK
jgi:hypothetical protein